MKRSRLLFVILLGLAGAWAVTWAMDTGNAPSTPHLPSAATTSASPNDSAEIETKTDSEIVPADDTEDLQRTTFVDPVDVVSQQDLDSGVIEVVVQDRNGEVTEMPFLITVEVLRPGIMVDGKQTPGTWSIHHAYTEHGKARLLHVGFDLPVKITARPEDHSESYAAAGTCPTEEEGIATFTLGPAPILYTLTGRVLNEEGKVGANIPLQVKIGFMHGNGQPRIFSEKIRTDKTGYFHVPIKQELGPLSGLTCSLRLKATKRKPQRVANLEVKGQLETGIHDFGDIVLRPPPLLSQGRITDFDGTPVPSADVELEGLLHRSNMDGEEVWYDLDEWTVQSKEDGSFLLVGDAPQNTEYRLSVWHSRYRTEFIPIHLGERGLEITMDPGVTVTGRVLLDPNIGPRSLKAQVLNHDVPEEAAFYGVTLDLDGSFELDHQLPGAVSLILVSSKLHQEFLRIDGLLLSRDQPILDLGEIDLRGRLKTIRLSVVDESGNHVRFPHIWQPGGLGMVNIFSRPIEVTTSKEGLDIGLGAAGFRNVVLYGVQGDRKVILPGPLLVKIVIDNASLAPTDWKLLVDVEESENMMSAPVSRSVLFDPDPVDKELHALAAPGMHTVAVHLIRLPDGETTTPDFMPNYQRFPGVWLSDGSLRQQIEVLDMDYTQEFHLSVDPDLLQETIDRILLEEAMQH